MTRKYSTGNFDSQTCLCCMCRCGDHKCFQQLALKLPAWMQSELKCDTEKPIRREKKENEYQADLYQKSTYKQDFCDQKDIIDRYPLDHKKPVENLKPFSKYGYTTNNSLYRDEFIPWSRDEQELSRGKLHLPDHELKRTDQDGSRTNLMDISTKISDQLYNYYCPPHCVGDQKETTLENCLVNHKDRFNLGPPRMRTNPKPEKPHQPFSKFSTYSIDYKDYKISPQKKPKPKPLDVSKTSCPLSSDTSYRNAFTCPPEIVDNGNKPKGKGQADTLTVGDGPMVQQTTSMLDYVYPDVSVHKPVKVPREVFRPPTKRMETTTTTGRTYQKWKNIPKPQETTVKEKKHQSFDKHEKDVRRLVTTYQEDFDGLNSALCPCRVVEKYGPKVLEPRYIYSKSEKPHDIFYFKKNSEPGGKICSH